jgi:hypothetical protein
MSRAAAFSCNAELCKMVNRFDFSRCAQQSTARCGERKSDAEAERDLAFALLV